MERDRDRDASQLESPDDSVSVKMRPEIKKPPLYQVIIMNDDYTPMEFVVQILEIFFNKPPEEATRIMLQVHQTGRGLCGIYSFEIAETKVAQTRAAARQAQYPLRCVMEKV